MQEMPGMELQAGKLQANNEMRQLRQRPSFNGKQLYRLQAPLLITPLINKQI